MEGASLSSQISQDRVLVKKAVTRKRVDEGCLGVALTENAGDWGSNNANLLKQWILVGSDAGCGEAGQHIGGGNPPGISIKQGGRYHD